MNLVGVGSRLVDGGEDDPPSHWHAELRDRVLVHLGDVDCKALVDQDVAHLDRRARRVRLADRRAGRHIPVLLAHIGRAARGQQLRQLVAVAIGQAVHEDAIDEDAAGHEEDGVALHLGPQLGKQRLDRVEHLHVYRVARLDIIA